MTADVVALCRVRPDVEAAVAALLAAGPELRVGTRGDNVVELLDDGGELLLTVDGPLLVQVPGEVRRLLGPEVAHVDTPVWWVEARAASARQDAPATARRLADELVRRLGGTVWPVGPGTS